MRPVALLLVIAALGCGRTSGLPFEDQTPGGVFCGPGTHLYGSECLPDGPGTSGGAGSGSGGSGGFGGSGGGMRDMASGNDGGNQGGPATGDMAVPPIGDRAVAWQIDPAHSGGQPNTRLRPPLVRLWSYDAGGPISYPLVSDGRVFVPSGGGGSYIAALDSVTGARLWGPIALGGSYNQAASAAYDVALARLFVQNANGMVEALDPATGTSFWTEQLSAFEVGAITAQGGLLFVPGDWSTTVLDGKSGAMRWNGGFSGTPNAPALTPSAVYTCAIGGYVGANDPATGARVWTHAGGGDGGGGCFTVVGAGHVYFADWADAPVVLDANTGSVVGSFPGAEPPAIDGKHAYFLVGPNLQALDTDTNTVRWTFAGDGTLATQPITGAGYVYIGATSGMFYALDGDGQVVYSEQLPAAFARQSDFSFRDINGFAIAEDKLFISAGTVLYAYGSAS